MHVYRDHWTIQVVYKLGLKMFDVINGTLKERNFMPLESTNNGHFIKADDANIAPTLEAPDYEHNGSCD